MWVNRRKWEDLVGRVNEHERAMAAFRRAGILEIEQHRLMYATYQVPKEWKRLPVLVVAILDKFGFEVHFPEGGMVLQRREKVTDHHDG